MLVWSTSDGPTQLQEHRLRKLVIGMEMRGLVQKVNYVTPSCFCVLGVQGLEAKADVNNVLTGRRKSSGTTSDHKEQEPFTENKMNSTLNIFY